MLVKPVLDDLMTKVDSKYTLVTVSSRRARKILESQSALYDNPVSMALEEITEGDTTWERVEDDDEEVK